MADKFMYIPMNDKENYPLLLFKIKLSVATFRFVSLYYNPNLLDMDKSPQSFKLKNVNVLMNFVNQFNLYSNDRFFLKNFVKFFFCQRTRIKRATIH